MIEIDGKKIAAEILAKLKQKPRPKKRLAAIIFGDDEISLGFIRQKEKFAQELGANFRLYKFPADLTNDEARKEVLKVANQKPVGGVIVQLPLPPQIHPVRNRTQTQASAISNGVNRQYVLNAIPPRKDIDVLGERALGAFYAGRGLVLPPAVGAVEEILGFMNYDLGFKKAAVVGLGILVGKPIATWLTGRVSELYLLRRGSDLNILKQADLVITGVGQAGLIKPEMLKEGAGVIDFGYGAENATSDMENEKNNIKLSGDFDALSLSMSPSTLSFYTPTPGGTGPIVVAKLFENFYRLNVLE